MLVWPENVPPRHGTGVEEPSAHHEPAGHALQLVLPSASWCLPAEHLTHAAAAATLNVPALHGSGVTVPVGQYEPAEHCTQPSGEFSPTAPLNEPGAQPSGALAPRGQ